MDPTTRQNLLTSMRTEAFEYLRYLLCARQARTDARAELVELFDQVAAQHVERFAAGARLVGLLGSDAENLRDAAREEREEAETAFRAFAEQAAAAGERAAADHFDRLRADDRAHHDAFRGAVRGLDLADPAE
jgi:rubrerythrin